MRRTLVAVILAMFAAACGSDGDSAGRATTPTTTAEATTPNCPYQPATFTTTDYLPVGPHTATSTGATGVLWQASVTFENPNAVPLTLSSPTITLDILGLDGHHRSNGKTSLQDREWTVPARGLVDKQSQVLAVPGHIPKTLSVYVLASAPTPQGSTCTVTVRNASPPVELGNLKDCEPALAPAAC